MTLLPGCAGSIIRANLPSRRGAAASDVRVPPRRAVGIAWIVARERCPRPAPSVGEATGTRFQVANVLLVELCAVYVNGTFDPLLAEPGFDRANHRGTA